MESGTLYRTKDLERLGLTQRAVQWWVETGVVSCLWQGGDRRFDERRVLRMLLVNALREKGVLTERIRRMPESLYAFKARFLLTDCRQVVRWAATETSVIRAMKAAVVGLLVIDVEELRRDFETATSRRHIAAGAALQRHYVTGGAGR